MTWFADSKCILRNILRDLNDFRDFIIQKRESQFLGTLSKKVAMTYSPTNICSTIGAVGLNFSVRDGKRWDPNAINRLNKGPITCRTFLVM